MSAFQPLVHRLKQSRQATAGYPRPFWFLFWGALISGSGTSIVWPFMTIYLRQRLGVPLATVGALLSLQSAAGLVATAFTGPAIDRFGRKGAMLVSLAASSVCLLAMSSASTLAWWAVLLAVLGGFGPLYRIGSNAMVADLVVSERRTEAYALLRMVTNLGIAIGPTVGGFVTSVSYALAFTIAAGASVACALLILLFVPESIPRQTGAAGQARAGSGYGPVLRDWPFLAFVGTFAIACMAYSQVMALLPVYAKENFGVAESRYGFIMATNAAMVVLFQYGVTRITRRYPDLPVLAVGAVFYALGVGSVALGHSFPAFLASMVILTIGELIVSPTSTALAANLAPLDMRGRYMGIYSLTWGIGFGIGPVLGGLLNDRVAPQAIWYGGLVMGLVAACGFALLARRLRGRRTPPGVTLQEAA